jgi:hypothetical protein
MREYVGETSFIADLLLTFERALFDDLLETLGETGAR